MRGALRRVIGKTTFVVGLSILVGVACGDKDTPTPVVITVPGTPVVVTVTPGPTATPIVITVAGTPVVVTPTPGPTATPRVITVAGTPVVVTATPPPPRKGFAELIVANSRIGVDRMIPTQASFNRRKSPMYDYFWEVDGEPIRTKGGFELLPLLVKEWSFSADLKTFTMKLQDGVQFHNGTEMTAADVTWWVDFIMNSDNLKIHGSELPARWEPQQMTARATGKYEVEFSRGDGKRLASALLFNDLSFRGSGLTSGDYVQSVGFAEADRNPIGTGPFRFVKRTPGTLQYEKTGSHFKYDPAMDRITILGVPESSVRIALIETGRADVALQVDFPDADYAQGRGFSIWQEPAGRNIRLVFGGLVSLEKGNAPWVNSKDVRLAMAMALDRETMKKALRYGFADDLNTVYISPNGTHLKGYGYDPEKAKQLLALAGYPNGFEVKMPQIIIGGGVWVPGESVAVPQYWEAIGIKTSIIPTDWSVQEAIWDSDDPAQSEGTAWLMATTVDILSPLSEWGRFDEPHLAWYRDQHIVDLVGQMREVADVDPVRFNALDKEALEYVHDQVGFIPFYTTPLLDVLGDGFVRWDNPGWSSYLRFHGLIFQR